MNSHLKKRGYGKFVAVFSVIFLLSFVFLYFFGLVPDELSGSTKTSFFDELRLRILGGFDNSQNIYKEPKISETPTYIEIPKAGVSINIQNPESTDVNVLNEYLRKGTVRYPGSGLIGDGNMFIFGHNAEAYKSVVNPALKAFNGIEDLVVGDEIYVRSEKETYVYKVTGYRLAKAEDVWVDFSKGKNMLTLSTCNTFGQKQERHIVEAEFAGKKK